MITLANTELALQLLDPVADRERLGSRYCWGGYIWQVLDAAGAPLVTGPEWPNPAPRPFNGQGLPESFRFRRRSGEALTWDGREGVHLGGGRVGLDAKGEPVVVEPCAWEIERGADRLHFRTAQRAHGYDTALEREVRLEGRTLWSSSRLTNRATRPLSLEWFPHPFFALTDRLIEAEVPPACRLADNPGFSLEGRRLASRKRFDGDRDGHMDFLILPPQVPVRARLSHPRLEWVDFATSYAPSECLIWGNGNTFSIEPYLTAVLAPGETREWWVSTAFGPARPA